MIDHTFALLAALDDERRALSSAELARRARTPPSIALRGTRPTASP